MVNVSELVPNPAGLARVEIAPVLASVTVPDLDSEDTPGTATERGGPRPAIDVQCLWCGRAFTPRMTGGSAQRFCSTGHRQAFWIAARRWTMRAIETGLLSVDCLKAAQASVHAAGGAFRSERDIAASA
jgi:hypothetical protein